MKLRHLFIFLILVLLAIFLTVNWEALSTVTTVNLVFRQIQAPLGVILCAVFGLALLVMLIYTVWQQASIAMELRTAYKEARAARKVADEADHKRDTQIHADMLERFTKLELRLREQFQSLHQRVTQMQRAIQNNLARNQHLSRAILKEQRTNNLQAKVVENVSTQLETPTVQDTPAIPLENTQEISKEQEEVKKKKNMFSDLF